MNAEFAVCFFFLTLRQKSGVPTPCTTKGETSQIKERRCVEKAKYRTAYWFIESLEIKPKIMDSLKVIKGM
jgi:hypothetical protein